MWGVISNYELAMPPTYHCGSVIGSVTINTIPSLSSNLPGRARLAFMIQAVNVEQQFAVGFTIEKRYADGNRYRIRNTITK